MNIIIITNRPESHIVNYTNSELSSERKRIYVSIASYEATDIRSKLHYNSIIIDTDHLGSIRTLKIIKALLKEDVPLSRITDLETEYENTH